MKGTIHQEDLNSSHSKFHVYICCPLRYFTLFQKKKKFVIFIPKSLRKLRKEKSLFWSFYASESPTSGGENMWYNF